MTNKEQLKEDAVKKQHYGTAFYPEEASFKRGFDAGWDAAMSQHDMIIHCPKCGAQHIDAPEPDICQDCGHPDRDHFNAGERNVCGGCVGINVVCHCSNFEAWLNPPHTSHQCHFCTTDGKPTVFRIADFPTNGVSEIKTRGSNDNYPEAAAKKEGESSMKAKRGERMTDKLWERVALAEELYACAEAEKKHYKDLFEKAQDVIKAYQIKLAEWEEEKMIAEAEQYFEEMEEAGL